MPSLVTRPLLGFLWRHALERAAQDGAAVDPDVPASTAFYAEPVMEHMLERLRADVERVAGVALYPTYSYLRVYRTGAVLEPHQDRPACEISLSLNLGQDPADPWALWIRGTGGAHAASLAPGDALLYRGIELEHWRAPYAGRTVAQVFLHYVNQHGPHAEWRFDKREQLGLTVPLPI